MKKHLFLLITAIIALSMIFTACLGGEDNPPKTDKPEPPAHDGVFVCGESSMTFNGDGKSIKLSIDPDTAALSGLPEGESEGTYVFLFFNGSYRYDLAEYFRIMIGDSSYQFDNRHQETDADKIVFAVSGTSDSFVFKKQ